MRIRFPRRQRCEIGVACAGRKPVVHSCECLISRNASRDEAPQDVQWNGERSRRRCTPGERAHSASIDAFAHRFGTRLDFISGGTRSARRVKKSFGMGLAICVLTHRARNVGGGHASRRELERALFERIRRKAVHASVSDHGQHMRSDIGRQHLAQTRRRIRWDIGRLCRERSSGRPGAEKE